MAQVSMTWVPWVLITLMVWFCFRGTATPDRAGIVCVVSRLYLDDGRAAIAACFS